MGGNADVCAHIWQVLFCSLSHLVLLQVVDGDTGEPCFRVKVWPPVLAARSIISKVGGSLRVDPFPGEVLQPGSRAGAAQPGGRVPCLHRPEVRSLNMTTFSGFLALIAWLITRRLLTFLSKYTLWHGQKVLSRRFSVFLHLLLGFTPSFGPPATAYTCLVFQSNQKEYATVQQKWAFLTQVRSSFGALPFRYAHCLGSVSLGYLV
jgi:hypothetical protein